MGLNKQIQGTHEDIPEDLRPMLDRMLNSPSVYQATTQDIEPDEGVYTLHLENEGRNGDFRFTDTHPAPADVMPLIKYLRKETELKL